MKTDEKICIEYNQNANYFSIVSHKIGIAQNEYNK